MSGKSSKFRSVRVLSHYQASDFPGSTYVPREVGEFLVNRMVCERISQKVVRMFPPEAVFAAVKMCPEVQKYIPETMPPAEVEDVQCKGFPPPDPASTIPRMRNLPRFREVYGDAQLAASV